MNSVSLSHRIEDRGDGRCTLHLSLCLDGVREGVAREIVDGVASRMLGISVDLLQQPGVAGPADTTASEAEDNTWVEPRDAVQEAPPEPLADEGLPELDAPPEPEPARKPQKARRAQKNAWSPEELEAIENAPTLKQAVESYRAKFGEGKRTGAAIFARWSKLHAEREAAGQETPGEGQEILPAPPLPADEPIPFDVGTKVRLIHDKNRVRGIGEVTGVSEDRPQKRGVRWPELNATTFCSVEDLEAV